MKILFTADWHIKLGAKNVPKEWQINRFNILFKAMQDAKADLVIIGGDIFDKMPSITEMELYWQYIASVNKETIIFDGNHEATKKGKTFLTYLKNVTSLVNSKVTIIDSSQYNYKSYGFDIIPYCELKTFNSNDFKSKLLFTHVRGSIPPYVIPEIDLNELSSWSKVLAGDLHSRENSQNNIIYPGSPMTISFHRNKVKTGYNIIDSDTLETKWIEIKIPQLIRKTITPEDMPKPSNYDHVIYEVKGNISELQNINIDESLLDKKIVDIHTDATLDLTGMTLQEELEEYLIEVLGIQGDSLERVLGVFNDYSN